MDIDKSGKMGFVLVPTKMYEKRSKDTYNLLLGQEGCNDIENFCVGDSLPRIIEAGGIY